MGKVSARLDAIADQLGRRGACLVLIGTALIVIGIGIEFDPPPRREGVMILHELLPHWLRAALWALTGAVAVWVGGRARLNRDDTWGFVAIMIMPIERCASFAVSWAMYVATDLANRWLPEVPTIGYDRGWYSALVWLVVVLLLQMISGWRNPTPPVAPDADVEG